MHLSVDVVADAVNRPIAKDHLPHTWVSAAETKAASHIGRIEGWLVGPRFLVDAAEAYGRRVKGIQAMVIVKICFVVEAGIVKLLSDHVSLARAVENVT